MKIPSDHQLEKFLNGYGIPTDKSPILVDRDVLLSVIRNIYLTGMNSKKGNN